MRGEEVRRRASKTEREREREIKSSKQNEIRRKENMNDITIIRWLAI